MALANGTRLGPYEIVAALGAGGMGEVYRAVDTRLDRTVAIKILPPHFADDATRRQRFEREAKVVSGLNHPNICTLHDIGHQDGVDFIVMEFLEGESLAERIEKGPLPAPQVMQYGTQLASALDKAHRNGVTHRDLKPGNIILTKSGAKLLDFGLAKAETSTSMGKTLTDATPRPQPMTQLGTIIGTVPYMSPEQLDGKEVDARSDIFSLGAVLYEMVTSGFVWQRIRTNAGSQRAICGTSCAGSQRAVRNRERRLHFRPGRRRELGLHLAWRTVRPKIAWIVAALFAIIAAVALLMASRSGRGHKPLAFRQLNFRREAIFQAAFAGDTVVYSAATSDNTPQIFAVRPDYPEPQPVGSRGMTLLAVLLNAHYVWYRLFTGTLARMTLGGGAPREIQEEGVRQADWSPDGSQLAIIREVDGKDRLEYPIGHVLREVSGSLSDLRFSPKGDRIA
jgi:eukaryotic-like serine/threonine-protein kinase